jgi:hypothetical protein
VWAIFQPVERSSSAFEASPKFYVSFFFAWTTVQACMARTASFGWNPAGRMGDWVDMGKSIFLLPFKGSNCVR